jgi:hypothetical protein
LKVRKRIFLILFVVVALLVSGCQSKAADSAGTGPTAAPKTDPMSVAFEQVSSGFYQVGAIMDEVDETLKQSDALLKSNAKSADAKLLNDLINQVGQGLGEIYEPAPERADFDKSFDAWDEKRLKAITAVNDARFEMRDVGDLIQAMREDKVGTGQDLDELERITGLIQDDLAEAVETLGGKVEPIEGQ